MSSAADKQGGQVDIRPRRMNFPFSRVSENRFFNNNVLLSAFGVALSGTFPPGEAEFIESVRLYRDQIRDPELLEKIRGFIGQEGHHSLQHRKANEALQELGWDAKFVEDNLAAFIRRTNGRRFMSSPKWRLASTVGMEHMTAIMAEFMLNNSDLFDSLDETVKELLLWHAVEEIEHKSVAFDVFMTIENDQRFLRKAMRIANFTFATRISYYMAALLWKARAVPSWREVKEFYRFMWGKRGLLKLIKPAYKDYFRDGFHPWDHQNQALINEWKKHHYRPQHDKGSDEYSEAVA